MTYIHKYRSKIAVCTFIVLLLTAGCTKLDETLYSDIASVNFLQTREDVIRDFLRGFDHAYASIQNGDGEGGFGALFFAQELPTDELMTPNRDGDWFNGGVYQRSHYHTWTLQDSYISAMWTSLFQGAGYATNSMEDIEKIDAAKFNLTEAEKADFLSELKTMRAWFHLRAFDLFRNIPLVKKVHGENLTPAQSTPQETFNWIESELKAAIPGLPTRESLGSNAIGRWTKGSAAALLVRLYLNAKVYIGVDKYTECAAVAQDIISGVYGTYALESTWYGPFDYTNKQSAEIIFGFPSSQTTHYHYGNNMYNWMAPHQANKFFGYTGIGVMNTKFSLQPGRDVDSVEYSFKLGKPFIKFQKYADDFRLKKYKNLGNSTREGMFLYGYLPYYSNPGVYVKSNRGYTIFSRDQVGWFKALPPGQVPTDKESNINHADDNSGVWPAKYPFYPDGDANAITASYAEIRLAEVYYSLAECKYRAGDKAGAAVLLNAVRKRNYPEGSSSLYNTNGSQLTDQEMLDEWGREFLVEGRRRIDLIRWGVFNTGTWWDKQPDADDHTKIYPIGQNTLSLSSQLKQNPGY